MGKLDVVLKQHAELRQEGVSTVSPRVHEEEEEENVAQKSDPLWRARENCKGSRGNHKVNPRVTERGATLDPASPCGETGGDGNGMGRDIQDYVSSGGPG